MIEVLFTKQQQNMCAIEMLSSNEEHGLIQLEAIRFVNSVCMIFSL